MIPALVIGAAMLGFSERIVMSTVDGLGGRMNAAGVAAAGTEGAAGSPIGDLATTLVGAARDSDTTHASDLPDGMLKSRAESADASH
jgi:hypothetical protein